MTKVFIAKVIDGKIWKNDETNEIFYTSVELEDDHSMVKLLSEKSNKTVLAHYSKGPVETHILSLIEDEVSSLIASPDFLTGIDIGVFHAQYGITTKNIGLELMET